MELSIARQASFEVGNIYRLATIVVYFYELTVFRWANRQRDQITYLLFNVSFPESQNWNLFCVVVLVSYMV